MNMREQFEARFPTPAGVAWSDEHQNYGWVKKSAFQKTITYRALFTGWQAAQGIQGARADCVIVDEAELNSSAFTAVDMGTAAADGYRDGVDNVEPEWVVNSIAELGVKVGDRFYFLYKGASLEYTSPEDEHEKPLMWRPVFKREFGEVCTPINRYAQGLVGTVSHEDSEEWKPLPDRSVAP